MNERIRELEKLATETVKCGLNGTSTAESFNRKKFAQLIIQGCISQIALIGISNFENDDVGWAVDKSIENIRKHFGVENETK